MLSRISTRDCALVCILCLAIIAPSSAQESTSAPQSAASEASSAPRVPSLSAVQDEKPRAHVNREWLSERGLSFSFSYTSEAFATLSRNSELSRGGEYLGSIESSIALDLHKLWLGRGQVIVSAQSIHGRGVNASHVDAFQSPSNLDSAGFSKLTEAWYGDVYLGGRVRMKAGWQYADAEFNVTENAGDFLNSSYGTIPTIPLPTYPSSALGVCGWFTPLSWISVGGGVYRGAEFAPSLEERTSDRRSAFTIFELNLKPHWNSRLHGVYRIGAWKQARGAVSGARTLRNAGIYATSDHWFRRANSAGENSGPGVFVQAGWAPADRNQVTSYLGTGLAWKGLGSRLDDSAGAGLTQVSLSSGVYETAIELFYRTRINKNLSLQPDMQFFNRPSGSRRSSLVGGIRLSFEI